MTLYLKLQMHFRLHFALCTLQTAVLGGGNVPYPGRRKRKRGGVQGPVRHDKGVPKGYAFRQSAWRRGLQEGKLNCTAAFFLMWNTIGLYDILQTWCRKFCEFNYLQSVTIFIFCFIIIKTSPFSHKDTENLITIIYFKWIHTIRE